MEEYVDVDKAFSYVRDYRNHLNDLSRVIVKQKRYDKKFYNRVCDKVLELDEYLKKVEEVGVEECEQTSN